MSLSLDKGTIDNEVIDALKQWKKVYDLHDNPYIGLRRSVYDNEYLMQPVTIALFEENLTFFNKYFKRAHFEHYIYNHFNVKALESLYKNKINSPLKKVYFNFYYSPLKAFKFSSDYYAMGKRKYKFSFFRDGWDYTSRDWIYGSNLKWDVPNELYKGNNMTPYYFSTYQKSSNLH